MAPIVEGLLKVPPSRKGGRMFCKRLPLTRLSLAQTQEDTVAVRDGLTREGWWEMIVPKPPDHPHSRSNGVTSPADTGFSGAVMTGTGQDTHSRATAAVIPMCP